MDLGDFVLGFYVGVIATLWLMGMQTKRHDIEDRLASLEELLTATPVEPVKASK
jgi:hypothetical protein